MSVSVDIGEQELLIGISGIDLALTLTRRLTIPLSTVTAASVVEAAAAKARVKWRLVGSAIPGLARAGRFSVKQAPGEREFWVTHRGSLYLQIETTDPKRRRVVLEIADAAGLVVQITTAVASR